MDTCDAVARRTKVSWKSRKSAWVRRDFPGLTGRVTALEVLPHQQYSPTCCMLSHSVVSDSATPWTVAHQAHLSMGFSRQEQWSGWLFPPSGDLPDPGIEPESLTFPALAGGFFTTSATWEAQAFNKCKLLILFSLLDIEE